MTLKECSNKADEISLEIHCIIAGLSVLYDALDDRKDQIGEDCAAALMGFISALKRQENDLDNLADTAMKEK